jgi:hypothetical protein
MIHESKANMPDRNRQMCLNMQEQANDDADPRKSNAMMFETKQCKMKGPSKQEKEPDPR